MSHGIAIGKVSEATGVKVPTIRYYEQIGLLPAPPRTEGNRRTYDLQDTERLTFIRHSRELGFDIDEIRTLLSLQDRPDQSCQDADAIAKTHLAEVKEKIASLTALQHELERMQPWSRGDVPGDRDLGGPRQVQAPSALKACSSE
jgi:DNA-binding transcriptional MerR regulator